MKHARIILALVFLVISLSLLVWGFFPNQREVRRQPIEPTQMQLPAPEGFHQPAPLVQFPVEHIETSQTERIAACFVLLL
ncbi:MAG: hypothetical protein R6W69_16595 [Anaerolineales bacterium]